jgi:hypothetical protein
MTGRTNMSQPSWLIQIFEMTDVAAREVVVGFLSPITGLTVEVTHNGPDCFLIVQSHDAEQAESVARLVIASDERAILLHTSCGPPAQVDLVSHVFNADSRALRLVRNHDANKLETG